MPYWKCFLLTGAVILSLYGGIEIGEWIEEHKPKWLDLYLITIFSALIAVIPYMIFRFWY